VITDAPRYDCLGAVTATVDADGSYLFDVSTLVRGDAVAVAILPTTPTSRIVFAVPGDDSLPVTPAPRTEASPASGAAVPAPPAAAALELPPATVAAANALAPDAPAAVPSPAAAPSPASAIGSVQAATRGSAGRAYFLLAVAAAAGLAWVFAGRARRPQVTAG
jgi:hypothetical protein